jgi:opacity protein-like surface antigen
VRFGIFGQWSSADFNVREPATATTLFPIAPPDAPPEPAAGAGSLDGGGLGFSYGVDLVRNASWVLGIEGDVSIEFAEDEVADRDYSTEFMSTLRGRIGSYVRPGWLVYATGGVAVLGVDFHGLREVAPTPEPPDFVAQRSKITDTLTGWTIGGGTEIEWGHVIFFGEYLFADYETWRFRDDIDPDPGSGTINGNPNTAVREHLVDIDGQHVFRLGVKFMIGQDYIRDYGCCGTYK